MMEPISFIREMSRRDLLFFAANVTSYQFDPQRLDFSEEGPHGRMARFYQETERQGKLNLYPRTLLMAPRGLQKCQLASEPVATPKGVQRLGDLRPGDPVYGWDDGKLVVNFVTNNELTFASGLLKVTLRTGRSFVVTPHHPFATWGGWTHAEDLQEGQEIRTIRQMPNPYSGDEDLAYLADEAIQDVAFENIYWDRVVKVEPGYNGTIAQLEVSGNHTYISDGVVMHNTTFLVQTYALWHLFQNPNARILLVSAKSDLAKMTLAGIKTWLETNRRLRSWFPELLPGPLWRTDSLTIAGRTHARKEPSIRSAGVDSTITGEHYDLILVDDIVTPLNSKTAAQLRKSWDFITSLTPILENGGKDAQLRITGTRYHKEDIYGRIIRLNDRARKLWEKKKKEDPIWGDLNKPELPYEVLILKAIENGESILPDVLPLKWLLRLKALNPRDFSRQYMNEVMDVEEQLVTFDELESWIEPAPKENYPTYASIDPASSVSDDADRTGIVVWKQRADGKSHIIYLWAKRAKPEDVLDKVYSLHQAYNFNKIYLETNALGQVYQGSLRKDTRGYLPVVGIRHNPGNKKDQRIEGLWLYAKNDHLRFAPGLNQWDDFVEEAIFYPRAGTDDLVDAAAEIPVHSRGTARVITIDQPFEPGFGDFDVW